MKKNIKARNTSKKQKPNRKNKKSTSQNQQKGKLLEKVVAALFKSLGVNVETNVHYPTTDGERTREIDILMKTQVMGLPVEFVFQCKNEASPLDVNKVGEFVGVLKDIGIPTQYGVFVSVNGFTSGAIAYAKKFGIQTLEVRGFSANRLKSELSVAIQHNVFLIPRVNVLTLQNNQKDQENEWQYFIFLNEKREMVGTIADLVFNKWQNGEIPAQIGTHNFEMEIPKGWFQYHKGAKIEPKIIVGEVTVLALVIKLDGSAETHLLIDAETQRVEKFRTQAKFNSLNVGESVPLSVFSDEESLNNFINSSSNNRLTVETKLPRLIARNIYYPLSETVAQKVFTQMQHPKPGSNQITQEQFDQEMYELSKNDLFAAGMFSFTGKEVPVITTDNDGETVDVTQLFREEEYDKIIALENKYMSAPSKLFANLLAWSYVKKSHLLFNKAEEKTGQQRIRLLAESLVKIRKALQLESILLAAVDHLATILFAQNEYKEALKAIEYIINREPEAFNCWVDKAIALTKLEEYEEALKAINTASDLVETKQNKSTNLPPILLRRAKILLCLGRTAEAWNNLLQAWELNPETTIEYSSVSNTPLKIIDSELSVQGVLLKIETFYSRATIFQKDGQTETAFKAANEAFMTLDVMKLADQVENEPQIIGELNSDLLDSVLIRTVNRLRNIEDSDFANEQIDKIKDWFRRTFEEEPLFLETTNDIQE